MALLAHNVDYTDKDFDALRARLIELIRSVFPDWSDFEVAGFGCLRPSCLLLVGPATHISLLRISRPVTS